jgi:hypothetical protein
MNELQRAYVAGNYVHLQGYRFVPIGILCILMAAWNLNWLRWVPLTDDRAGQLAVLLLMCSVIASYMIQTSVYEARFGSALPKYRLGMPGVLLATILCLAAAWLQRRLSTTVSLPALVVALCLGWLSIRARGLRNHYIALSAAWALLTVVPLLQPETEIAALYGLIGISLIVGGVGDHRVLTRVLRSVEQDQL